MFRIPRRLQTGLGLMLLLWGIVGATAADPPPEGPARLVHDFFPGEFVGGQTPPQLTRLGNTLFFVADDLDTGRSVWRTDGSPAGTQRLPVPDALEGDAYPAILGLLGPRVLWMTNAAGTPNAWVLVSAGRQGDADVLSTFTPGRNLYGGIEQPAKVGQRFFFQSCTARECTFWSTDGTPAGTEAVRTLASRFTKTDQQIAGAFADRWLVFRSESALYAYDVPRDRVLLLLPTGARGFGGVRMYPVGDSLFLLTRHDRYRLWISRLDAPRASQIFKSEGLTISGWRDDRLYFITGSGQLWSTDGNPGGTRRYSHGSPEPYTVLADRLGTLGPITFLPVPGYYSGGLYAADENRSQLREIHHTCTGKYDCLGSSMSDVTTAGDHGFLEINGSLWQSDGTSQGTRPHEVLGRTNPDTFRVLGGRLILGSTSREGEEQLWETDGTAAGTRALSDPEGGPFRVQAPPVRFAGALYTSAIRKPAGQQLWRVADGRATPVTDLRHLASGLDPYLAIPVGQRLVLQGPQSPHWIGLAEDGSIETLPPVYNGCYPGDPCPIQKIVLGERLLFEKDLKLWFTDGTAAGTGSIPLGNEGEREIAALGRFGDRALIFDTRGGLWTSDGSSARFIAQLPNAPDWWEEPVGPPLALGPLAFQFRWVPVQDKDAALELWRTDGTAAGTLRIASIPFKWNFTIPSLDPTLLEGRLFFHFLGVLWVSDGSVEGTHPLADPPPGGVFALAAGTRTLYAATGPFEESQALWAIDPKSLQSSRIGTFSWLSETLGNIVGNTLLFEATDENGVGNWWVTEGTPQSTHPAPEPLASLEAGNLLVTAGNRHYFSLCDAGHGCELWSTDRLGEDTRRVQDLWPGPRGSDPRILTVTEDAIWFAATHPDVGRELWKIGLSQGNP